MSMLLISIGPRAVWSKYLTGTRDGRDKKAVAQAVHAVASHGGG
jgi:hypothetical protein